ncbi:MAG: SUMF1/EgtB/PvdO family nonheme iron enzyme [Chloroflexota bacterium]
MSKIFISYRRKDSRLVTNRIYDRFRDAFGKDYVFKDVDTIPAGRDFRGVLREATAQCEVMLVIIGPDWLTITDKAGNRRLDKLNDFVRLEVETGLQRDDKLVIPVLIEGALMPSANDLPDTLKPLAYNNAFHVDDDPRFHRDMDTLIEIVRENITDTSVPKISRRWSMLTALAVLSVILLAILSQNSELLPFGGDEPRPIATTQVAQQATQTPSPRPLTWQEQLATVQAEQTALSLTEQAFNQTATVQRVQNTTATAQQNEFDASETAAITTIEFLSATPTNTPNIVTPTPEIPEAERIALAGVTSNAEWEAVVGNGGYTSDFNNTQMVLVPVGEFEMGSTEEEINTVVVLCDEARKDEDTCSQSSFENQTPTNIQKIEVPFWIDKYEVSRIQYQMCIDAGICSQIFGSQYSSDDNQPINQVTWFQADEYCAWRDARLPTEVEWEYAARGPDRLLYPWGNEFDESLANHCDVNCANADWAQYYNFLSPENDDGYDVTAPVTSFENGASWVGALNMSGNVWEWTSTLYDQDNFPYPYVNNDGREDDTGERANVPRVRRGGSFTNTSYALLSTTRWWLVPNNADLSFGFRCARSYDQ